MTIPTFLGYAALVGLLSGAHASIWGMYKDAIHEGFAPGRFARSMIVGALCAIAIQSLLRLALDAPGNLVLLFGLAYGAERGVVEVWKTFFRNEDQSKYFIPMQFSIRGEPVKSRLTRITAGLSYVAVVSICLLVIARLDASAPVHVGRVVLVGLVVGLIVAAGGGWKDAPKEGFDPLKFMRSPAMTVVAALVLSRFTDSSLLIAVGAIGYERAAAETYKTFFFPSRPRGKFSGKPIAHPAMLRHRRHVVLPFAAIWMAVVICGALAT